MTACFAGAKRASGGRRRKNQPLGRDNLEAGRTAIGRQQSANEDWQAVMSTVLLAGGEVLLRREGFDGFAYRWKSVRFR